LLSGQDDDVTTTENPVIDLLDREFWRRNPHDVWTWCRANAPVYRDETNELWAITRHADILQVERNGAVFSSQGTYRANEGPTESNMIANDDPRHQQQRRLVNRRFTPRSVRAQTDEFSALIAELVDAATPAGTLEVIGGLAAQLPSRLTCRLLGIDEDQWPKVRSWSERLMRIDSAVTDPEVLNGLIESVTELMDYVQEAVPEKRGCPADDLMSVWASAEIDGEEFPIESVFHEVGLFVSGGAETTRTAIAHGLRAFCDHPDQWERLAAEPETIPAAVDEVIRWVTPLNNFFRKATEDTEIGGQAIAAGDRVMLVYPSANRDEAVFDEPFTFDTTRSPNHHISFGYGTHFCIGANFARHELTLLFEKLTRDWTNLRVVTEPDVEPNIFARAVRSFDLSFDAR
jgi:cytochrome P450 family 142 subfamily A polypeptide 1